MKKSKIEKQKKRKNGKRKKREIRKRKKQETLKKKKKEKMNKNQNAKMKKKQKNVGGIVKTYPSHDGLNSRDDDLFFKVLEPQPRSRHVMCTSQTGDKHVHF